MRDLSDRSRARRRRDERPFWRRPARLFSPAAMTRRRRSRSRGWRKRPSVRSTSTFPASATFSTSLFLSAAGRCWPLSTHRLQARATNISMRSNASASPFCLDSSIPPQSRFIGWRSRTRIPTSSQALWSSGHAPVKQGIRRFLEQGAALGHVVCADLDLGSRGLLRSADGVAALGSAAARRAAPRPDRLARPCGGRRRSAQISGEGRWLLAWRAGADPSRRGRTHNCIGNGSYRVDHWDSPDDPKRTWRQPQAVVAPTPNGHGAKPKRTWRQTQIHANFFQ